MSTQRLLWIYAGLTLMQKRQRGWGEAFRHALEVRPSRLWDSGVPLVSPEFWENR